MFYDKPGTTLGEPTKVTSQASLGLPENVTLRRQGEPYALHGEGNGPIDAFVAALGLPLTVLDYHEHAIGAGADARAACYVELRLGESAGVFGVGVDSHIVAAALKAVLSALNRQLRAGR